MSILDELSINGYSMNMELRKDELSYMLCAITRKWEGFYETNDPDIAKVIKAKAMDISQHHMVEVSEIQKRWIKDERLMDAKFTEWFLRTGFAQRLREEIGDYMIADEMDRGWGNIYFRLVRPSRVSDVGPIHRDSWFWEANEGFSMKGRKERIKVWIPLVCETGKNGLLVERASHTREDLIWAKEMRDGIMKPVFDAAENNVRLFLVASREGQAIVFHDKLLHGGMINKGQKTRVSIEFTCLV